MIVDWKIKKLLKYGVTRWLSMGKAIDCFLEQWDTFFCEDEKANSSISKNLTVQFESPETELYLVFLQSILQLFRLQIWWCSKYHQKFTDIKENCVIYIVMFYHNVSHLLLLLKYQQSLRLTIRKKISERQWRFSDLSQSS